MHIEDIIATAKKEYFHDTPEDSFEIVLERALERGTETYAADLDRLKDDNRELDSKLKEVALDNVKNAAKALKLTGEKQKLQDQVSDLGKKLKEALKKIPKKKK